MSGDRRSHTGSISDFRQPFPGESANGYAAAWGAATFAPRMLDITASFGADHGQHAAPYQLGLAAIEGLAQSLGVEPEDLVKRAVRDRSKEGRVAFFGCSLDHRHFKANVRRFAPEALEQSPHHRALWMLTPFPFCTETWQFLVQTCPNPHCLATQRWDWTNGVDVCDKCGEPLTRAVADEVPPSLRRNLEAAVGLVHPDAGVRAETATLLPVDLSSLGSAALLDLLCATAGFVDPGVRYRVGKQLIDAHCEPKRVTNAIASAWSVLEGWPDAFEKLATDRLAERTGRHGDGNGGATRDFLRLPSRCELASGVASVIDKMRNRFEDGHARGYTPKEAAAKCGVRVAEIAAARRSGRLPAVFQLDGNRSVALISRSAVDGFAAVRVPYFVAASTLGITYRAIEELVSVGLLEPFPLGESERNMASVTKSSLDNLIDRIRSASRSSVADGVPLRLAMRVVGGRLKPWAPAIRAMLDGSLPFQVDERGRRLVWRAAVPRSAVTSILNLAVIPEPAPETFATHMSKADAADALGLLPRQYRSVLGDAPTSHGWERTVPVSFVEDMCQRLISTAEISRLLDLPPKHVRFLMAQHGVERISEAGYDRSSFDLKFAGGQLPLFGLKVAAHDVPDRTPRALKSPDHKLENQHA